MARTLAVLCAVFGLAGGLVDCASSSLRGGLAPAPKLPVELPKEMLEKFEVKDVPVADTSPKPFAAFLPVEPPPELGPNTRAQARKKRRHHPPKAAVSDSAPPSVPFQYPSRRPAVDPAWVGEKLTYEVTYFGVAAGLFTLEVLPYKEIGGRKTYHFKGTAVTSKVFSLFYRLDDSVDSFMDFDGLFSRRFQISLDESKQARDALELYDSEKGQTFYWNRMNRKDSGYVETREFQPISPFPEDSLSVLYFLRMIPLSIGEVFSFPVVSEGKTLIAKVTVLRHEQLDTALGPMTTIVLKPETWFHGVLEKRGDSFLWFSDDERRFPVRVEAKVKVGTVVATLKSVVPGGHP